MLLFSNSQIPWLLLVLLCLVSPFQQVSALDDPLCQVASSSLEKASKIRGLEIKTKVPCLVRDKEHVKKYLLHTIKTKLPPNKLKHEEQVYKALGLLPAEFDYSDGLIELYLSQIGGYYDPEEDHFVMAAWMPAILQTTVAVHELTHGLQDQYFDLEKFVNPKIENSDLLLARSALVEGDATAVMFDYARQLAGQGSIAEDPDVEGFMIQNILGASLVTGSVPESLKMMLIFPYTSGLRFVHQLLRKGGYERVNQAFGQPPRSTEEILHPEKYYQEQADFREISDEQQRSALLPESAVKVYSDTMGEFAISAMLGNYAKNRLAAAQASQGWGGDRVALYQVGSSSSTWVVWKTIWDTESDAQQFFAEFETTLRKRFVEISRRKGSAGPMLLRDGTKLHLKREGLEIEFVVEPKD
ncbi:MAG: hypothetical protein KDD42_07760 [Bdellovibrionales bacterium]|nr:hypothetical protein [Bdellovibrionales bacterium]